MMGVYIKNITKERAERCLQCAKNGWCIDEIPEIIELPQHGRLIDADVMKTKIDGNEPIVPTLLKWIDVQPTIIPASEKEE